MSDKSNTANQQMDKTLIRSKQDEQRREAQKIEQKAQKEENSENPINKIQLRDV